VDLVGFIIRIQ